MDSTFSSKHVEKFQPIFIFDLFGAGSSLRVVFHTCLVNIGRPIHTRTFATALRNFILNGHFGDDRLNVFGMKIGVTCCSDESVSYVGCMYLF